MPVEKVTDPNESLTPLGKTADFSTALAQKDNLNTAMWRTLRKHYRSTIINRLSTIQDNMWLRVIP